MHLVPLKRRVAWPEDVYPWEQSRKGRLVDRSFEALLVPPDVKAAHNIGP